MDEKKATILGQINESKACDDEIAKLEGILNELTKQQDIEERV